MAMHKQISTQLDQPQYNFVVTYLQFQIRVCFLADRTRIFLSKDVTCRQHTAKNIHSVNFPVAVNFGL